MMGKVMMYVSYVILRLWPCMQHVYEENQAKISTKTVFVYLQQLFKEKWVGELAFLN